MFSSLKKSRQNHAKRRKSNAKRQKRRRNGKQKPERYIAAPVYAFARRWGTAAVDGLGSAPLPGAGRALGLRLKSNISVSTHAPAWARRIHTCLIYLRKRLLIVIPRYDAESSVVKFRNVSESEAAGPRPVPPGARNGLRKFFKCPLRGQAVPSKRGATRWLSLV